jgi:hypothetical protein
MLQAVVEHTRVLVDELQSIIQEVMNCFEPARLSRVLGEPDRPGADRPMTDIEQYVSRLGAELNDAGRRASLGECHPVVLMCTSGSLKS